MKKVIRLTESDLIRIVKRVINEQESYPIVPLIIQLPYKKDATGKMIFNEGGNIQVTAKAEKNKEGKGLESYINILTIDFAGTMPVKLVNSKKDAQGNITGTFSVYGDSQKQLRVYLKKMVGKTLSPGDKSIYVTLTKTDNKTTTVPAGGTTTFTTYDTTTQPVSPSKN